MIHHMIFRGTSMGFMSTELRFEALSKANAVANQWLNHYGPQISLVSINSAVDGGTALVTVWYTTKGDSPLRDAPGGVE